jgi:hypothetical protein
MGSGGERQPHYDKQRNGRSCKLKLPVVEKRRLIPLWQIVALVPFVPFFPLCFLCTLSFLLFLFGFFLSLLFFFFLFLRPHLGLMSLSFLLILGLLFLLLVVGEFLGVLIEFIGAFVEDFLSS